MTRQEMIQYIVSQFRSRGLTPPTRLTDMSDRVIEALYQVEADAEDREIEDLAANIY